MLKRLADQPMPVAEFPDLGGNAARYFDVQAGGTQIFSAGKGDLVNIRNLDGGSVAIVTSLAHNERVPSGSSFEIDQSLLGSVKIGSASALQVAQLVSNRDGSLSGVKGLKIFDAETEPDAVFTIKLKQNCCVVVHVPLCESYLTEGGGGRMRVEHQPSTANSLNLLPDPLGTVVDEWRVERATAHAYEVKKGQFIQIVDVEGRQCSDFMAMRASALDNGIERYIDSTVSRTMARSAYPQPGLHDKFFDQDLHPLLAVRQDTVGRHDTFALACTARGYEDRGFPGHVNCSDNISSVFAPFGITPRKAWPAVNFFFNTWIDTHSNMLRSDQAWSRPGDYVVMQALTDLVCVSTACPDDVDPINGWNPTDIHVRIYEENSSIQHAVAHRNQPDDAARMTRHSPFHSRTSRLTSDYTLAQDIWLPTQFDASRSIGEYWACRERATLQDMSSLRKFDIVGPDAQTLLQHCMTRNVSKLAEHRGMYALMCDERGNVIDDGTLFRLEPTAFRWCCGSENSALHLRDHAAALGLRVWIKSLSGQMANLALQGPKSREILSDLIFVQPNRPALENIKWFGFTHARLRDRDGPIFMLTRTGFTGELGYEIFCDADDAEAIWDGVMEAGAPHSLVPMGGAALDCLRIEAGLMVSGAEFTPDVDAMEAGLEFAVDFKKPAFVGRDALVRNKSAVRRKLVGLKFADTEAPDHGDPVFCGREQVGVVTSAAASPALGHAIAMARVAVENAETGGVLEVGRLDGQMKRLSCSVTEIPFVDPKREKPRS